MIARINKLLKSIPRALLVALIVLCLSVAGVTSCNDSDDDKTDNKTDKTEKKKKKAKGLDKKPDIKTVEIDKIVLTEVEEVRGYEKFYPEGAPYYGRKKRDPFEPIEITPVGSLGEYDISLMKCNGVILGGPGGSIVDKANVWTPDGKTTIVHIGDPIGIHDGRIINLSKEGITVRENWLNERDKLDEVDRLIPVTSAEKKR